MSIETFKVTQPSELCERRPISRPCHCGFCGASVNIRKYADHVEKHRKQMLAGKPFKAISVPAKRSDAEIFTEWQQAEEVQS